MKYYAPVYINNLKTIQEKVFNLFPKDILEKKVNNLFYIPNNMNVLLNIPELKQVLDELGWTPNVFLFAFNIVQPTSGTTVHIDSGEMVYSFNIPILNCDDTYVNFYSTTEQPVMTTYIEYDKKINYLKYNLSHCELIDKLEMVTPHVIKVKEVHNITNLNTGPRITLLIRLKKEISLEHLFQ